MSTCLPATRTRDGEEMIAVARRLGFEYVELHHSLSVLTVQQLYKARQEGRIKVSSLHNFVPAPHRTASVRTGPDVYSLASRYTRERQYAVMHTKKTLDFARMFGAKAIVLHCGKIEMKNFTKKLLQMQRKEGTKTKRYLRTVNKWMGKRTRKRRGYLDALLRSLSELNELATRIDVKLGIETRYYLNEIPFFDEFRVILDEFKGGNVHYWHDVGHAQICEELDVMPHERFFEAYGEEMIGIHLHDIFGSFDHKAPLMGSFDFKRITPFLKKEHIKVLEAFSPATDPEWMRGIKYLRHIYSEVM
jgi:sugar phosphate isomerase/epimerase